MVLVERKKRFQKSLRAPLEVVKSYLNLEDMSEEQQDVLEKSLLADLVGDDPIRPKPYTRASKAATHLHYAILYLHSSISRFSAYRKMFGQYPWRGRISKSDHILFVYYLFAHEAYILEERLKRYFLWVEEFAKEKNVQIDVQSISKLIIKSHGDVFGPLVRARGVHVHQDDFVPRDLERISLIDTLLNGEEQDAQFNKVLAFLQKSAIAEARKRWINQCDIAENMSQALVALAFDSTSAVWKLLAKPPKAR